MQRIVEKRFFDSNFKNLHRCLFTQSQARYKLICFLITSPIACLLFVAYSTYHGNIVKLKPLN